MAKGPVTKGHVLAKGHTAKGHLRALVARGRAVPFASAQYTLGHACDLPQKWLGTRRVYGTAYRLGCEPYLLLSRRHAPPYREEFVGYGKDRVSYTYELAARGTRLRVQPEVVLVHYTTLQRGTAYSHSPKDWMVGETCWPAFAEHVRAAYRYEATSCAQPQIDR